MNQEQEYLIGELEYLLEKYSYYDHYNKYSTSDYSDKLEALKYMISSLLAVCGSLGLHLDGVCGSYLGSTVEANDFKDSDELMKYW